MAAMPLEQHERDQAVQIGLALTYAFGLALIAYLFEHPRG